MTPAFRVRLLRDLCTQHYLVLCKLQEAGADCAVRGQMVFHPQDSSMALPRPRDGGVGGVERDQKQTAARKTGMAMAAICFSETTHPPYFHPALSGDS